jgi:hypothetical protein
MPGLFARVVFTEMAEPRTGEWCGVCLLPSLIVVDLGMITEYPGGRMEVDRAVGRFCPEHDDRPRLTAA